MFILCTEINGSEYFIVINVMSQLTQDINWWLCITFLVWSYELKTLPSLKEGYSPGMFQDTFPTAEGFLQVVLYICPCLPPTINNNGGAIVSVFSSNVLDPGWCNGWRVLLKCARSWVVQWLACSPQMC